MSETAVTPDAAVSPAAWATIAELDPELWAAVEAERHRQTTRWS